MDIISTFACGKWNRDKALKVFDWEKAALIIKERGAKDASAGLSGAWEDTGGNILKDGVPVPHEETDVYLASKWATPELIVDGDIIACYRMQSETPGWDSDTYWPEVARKVLGV